MLFRTQLPLTGEIALPFIAGVNLAIVQKVYEYIESDFKSVKQCHNIRKFHK